MLAAEIKRLRGQPPVLLAGKQVNTYEAAKALEMNQSYLSKILIGKRRPSLTLAERIAAHLGFTLMEFLNAVEDRKKSLA